MEVLYLSKDTLLTRARTIYRYAQRQQYLQALKVIRVTWFNLENAQLVDLTLEVAHKTMAFLDTAAMYANRQNGNMIRVTMAQLVGLILRHATCFVDPIDTIPNTVRRAIEFAL